MQTIADTEKSNLRWSEELVALRHRVAELEAIQKEHESHLHSKDKLMKEVRERLALSDEHGSDLLFAKEQADIEIKLQLEHIAQTENTNAELEAEVCIHTPHDG